MAQESYVKRMLSCHLFAPSLGALHRAGEFRPVCSQSHQFLQISNRKPYWPQCFLPLSLSLPRPSLHAVLSCLMALETHIPDWVFFLKDGPQSYQSFWVHGTWICLGSQERVAARQHCNHRSVMRVDHRAQQCGGTVLSLDFQTPCPPSLLSIRGRHLRFNHCSLQIIPHNPHLVKIKLFIQLLFMMIILEKSDLP